MAVAYFNKRLKGYDTDEVDTFIINLVAESEQKIKELSDASRELRMRIKELEDQIDASATEHRSEEQHFEARIAEADAKYESLCAQMGEKMHIADERAAAIISAAQQKADDIISQAQNGAADIAAAAKAEAEAEARRIVFETRERCGAIERAAQEFERRQKEIAGGFQQAIAGIEAGLCDIQNKIKQNGGDINEQDQ